MNSLYCKFGENVGAYSDVKMVYDRKSAFSNPRYESNIPLNDDNDTAVGWVVNIKVRRISLNKPVYCA